MTTEQTKSKITFGADPEIFVLNSANGTLVPSWTLDIKGEKGKPEPLRLLPNFGALQDGVAVEFNTPTFSNIPDLKMGLLAAFEALWRDKNLAGMTFDLNNTGIRVPKKYQDHPSFLQVGCSSDLDAYSESGKREGISPEAMGENRFTGGHLHIGCDPWPDWLPKKVFIQFLDTLYLGIMGLGNSELRDQYYGMPGIWRETSYGVEYRTPSTKWLLYSNNSLKDLTKNITSILLMESLDKREGLVNFYKTGWFNEFIDQYNADRLRVNNMFIRGSQTVKNILKYGFEAPSTPTPIRLGGYIREDQLGTVSPKDIVGRGRDEEEEAPRLYVEVRQARAEGLITDEDGLDTTPVLAVSVAGHLPGSDYNIYNADFGVGRRNMWFISGAALEEYGFPMPELEQFVQIWRDEMTDAEFRDKLILRLGGLAFINIPTPRGRIRLETLEALITTHNAEEHQEDENNGE